MEPRIQYAKTSDGVNIAFATSGSGPPFVWMPNSGMPLSHLQSEWQLPYLRGGNERVSRRWTLVRYDPRGSGLSDRDVADMSLDAYVLDLEAVTDKLGLARFRMWVTGSNAPIALTYASRHPDRVSHLVLWHGQAGPGATGSGAIQSLTALAAKDWKLATESFALAFQGISEAEIARQYAEHIRASVTPEQFISLAERTRTWDVTQLLPSVAVPTLIVHYLGQPYISANAARTLAASIPNAQLSMHDEYAVGLVSPSASAAIRAFLRGSEEEPPEVTTPSGMTAILFADIVDSTALTERIGDTAFRGKARELDATLRTTIRDHSGTPIEGKLLGDGVLAVFTSARQGIEAALACGRAGDGAGLPLHLGLHAGDVIREDNNVYGGAVNIASRIAGLSAAGEVLVSETVRSLARTSAGVRFEDRGEQELKGVGARRCGCGRCAKRSDAARRCYNRRAMTEQRGSALTTILFTDLVNSTQLMQRAGDEDAQRIFKAHYQLLRDAVSANGGSEVKSLGDGLMVAFTSAADAVRCAIMVQQASRRRVSGERVAVKVGINAGEAMSEGDDYFGTPVVVARRLCDRAQPGQILCSAVIESILAGRQAFSFRDLGALELKGIAAPVEAREVAYETNRTGVLLTRTPFVGRAKEIDRLQTKLDEARAGHGGLVMLVGEPGIGKSRTIEEFAEQARAAGAQVLTGRCFEGEWAPPYAPFAEAIAGYAKDADPDVLGADLGYGAPPLARLVPSLRERLPDIEEPVPLNPDEERFRLLDAVSQFILATSARAPVVLVLDDLHWSDGGTIAMLHHVARFLPGQPTLVLGAYRDVELDRQHPLADALAALRREAEYERILIKGLDEADVRSLLTDWAEHDVPDAFVQAISAETDGNPFFIREVLIHLAEEGKIYQQDGRWASNVSIAEMGIPEGVRQVIGHRLSRLSENANDLLTAASGFNGPFRVDLAADAASLDEADALDALDAALGAQLVQPASGDVESYDFAHALIRHTLYGELSPSRQVRLHRGIAEAMERLYGDRVMEHAAELAYQYHRSAGLPGAERGADYAIAAADQAERLPAWDQVAVFSRMALDLLPEADARRPHVAGRLGLALARSTGSDEAARACAEAADTLAKAEGDDAAADYLAGATGALWNTNPRAAWDLATQGMAIIGTRRDATWAQLASIDAFRRAAEDPDDVGIPLLTEERREIMRVLEQSPYSVAAFAGRFFFQDVRTREEAVAQAAEVRGGGMDDLRRAWLLMQWVGDYRTAKEVYRQSAERAEREGDIGFAVSAWANVPRCCYALGELTEGDAALARCDALAPRLTGTSVLSALAARATGGLVRRRGAAKAGGGCHGEVRRWHGVARPATLSVRTTTSTAAR